MLESIKTFLSGCEQISAVKGRYLDYSGGEVSVSGGDRETLKEYIDGDRLMKFKFEISFRVQKNGENGEFAADAANAAAAWLRNQSDLGNLPSFEGGKIVPHYFEIENDPVLAENSFSSAKFTLECYLVYYEKRR